MTPSSSTCSPSASRSRAWRARETARALRAPTATPSRRSTRRSARSGAMIYGLGPAQPQLGIRSQLLGLVRDLETATDLVVEVTFEGPVDTSISEEIGEHLRATASESLSNVGRHAHATRAWLSLGVTNGICELQVIDDGRGIGLTSDQPGGGMGLVNLRRRAEKLGGSMESRRLDTGGARLSWRVPIRTEYRPRSSRSRRGGRALQRTPQPSGRSPRSSAAATAAALLDRMRSITLASGPPLVVGSSCAGTPSSAPSVADVEEHMPAHCSHLEEQHEPSATSGRRSSRASRGARSPPREREATDGVVDDARRTRTTPGPSRAGSPRSPAWRVSPVPRAGRHHSCQLAAER